MFSDIFKHSDQVNRLQYICAALKDAAQVVAQVEHQDKKNEYVEQFQKTMREHLETEILKPLCSSGGDRLALAHSLGGSGAKGSAETSGQGFGR